MKQQTAIIQRVAKASLALIAGLFYAYLFYGFWQLKMAPFGFILWAIWLIYAVVLWGVARLIPGNSRDFPEVGRKK